MGPFVAPQPDRPACPARPKPALGAAGPPWGGWRFGRRGEAGNGLPLTVAIGPTTQALKHASCAPMSPGLGWAQGAHLAVPKFCRSPITRSAVAMAISALPTRAARRGSAHGRVRARGSRCSQVDVVLWEARAAWRRAGRARARGTTWHRWQPPRGSPCARAQRRGPRAGPCRRAPREPFCYLSQCSMTGLKLLLARKVGWARVHS